MARRRYISTDISVDSKLNRVSEFAVIVYTWGIAHARDDCRLSAQIAANRRISPQNAEELLLRIVPGRRKTIEDMEKALEELIQAELMGIDENGEFYYPSNSFYKYQTYINAEKRRETPQIASSSSSSSSLSVKEESRSGKPAPSADLAVAKNNGRQSMGRSMNLIPELKKETDRLYNSDPVKFKRIAAWVAQGRKHEFLETDMAAALREFWDYRMVDDWYPYLDTVLEKVVSERNRDVSIREHERRKAEEARPLHGPLQDLVKGLANAKKA